MDTISKRLIDEITNIKDKGLYKKERIIQSTQQTEIIVNKKVSKN